MSGEDASKVEAATNLKLQLDELGWLAGAWCGDLGDRTVTENWSAPNHGVMATKVEIADSDGIQMFELISICEESETLALHLRQFSPQLDLRLAQTMQLDAVGEQMVSFVAPEAGLQRLTYHRQGKVLEAKVTVGNAELVATLRAEP